MSHRYRFLGRLVSDDGQAGSSWCIEGDECFHLGRVLRLKAGDTVELSNGLGCSALGSITSLSKQAVHVTAGPVSHSRRSESPLILALGALKPRSVDDLLPSLVELGVDEIHVFLQAEVAKNRLQSEVLERWQRIVLAAIKQCKRPFTPELHAWASLGEWVTASQARLGTRLYCSDQASGGGLFNLTINPGPLFAVVGGEKGLSVDDEALLLEQGFTGASLGPYILRAQTAALAAVAILAQRRMLLS